ncbi:MAG: alpha/beta hydrolase-fold protein [Candidatus Bathyarchaeota archaeon]|nr:alpha/beta hydrolase-fold protein [Candidatus Bathyarchaeota archaeon]
MTESIELGQKVKIHSEILGEDRELIVRLPETYATTKQRYPLLYMLDANYTMFFANDVLTTGFLRWVNKIPEVILIGVLNTDRERDMIPVQVEEKETSGGSDKFLRFFTDELKPTIDSSYRTTNYSVLYGASNAGLFTIYAQLIRPDIFNSVIASSPTIGWCHELIHNLAEETFRSKQFQNKLYMIYGKYDYDRVTEYVPNFAKLLEEKAPDGYRWAVKRIDDEGHVPYTSLYDGLRFVFPQRSEKG